MCKCIPAHNSLFAFTGLLIRLEASRLVLKMSFESMFVVRFRLWWLLIIIATSSSEVLPALSPIPLIVTSTCLAPLMTPIMVLACLLYTSDAADDLLCVDLGGRRII